MDRAGPAELMQLLSHCFIIDSGARVENVQPRRTALRAQVRIANFGCRDFGVGDPLRALLPPAAAKLIGLCVDVDAEQVEIAGEVPAAERVCSGALDCG